MAAVTARVIPEIPAVGHGEMAAKPSPEPSASSTSDTVAVTKAPAPIAGQETAEGEGIRGSAARSFAGE